MNKNHVWQVKIVVKKKKKKKRGLEIGLNRVQVLCVLFVLP